MTKGEREAVSLGQHVLVIEDDPAVGRLMTFVLTDAGFQVSITPDAEVGLATAKEDRPDVVLLDLNLQRLSCQDTLTALKKSSQVPVIVLTYADFEDVLVECLQLGGFDIAFKPFDPDDLEACVRLAVGVDLTRSTSLPTLKGVNLEIDFAAYRFTKAGQPLRLSLSEWRLLEVLASRPGQTVLYQELLGRVWGGQFRNRLSFLQVWITRLQKKIGLAEFHGVGYALVV